MAKVTEIALSVVIPAFDREESLSAAMASCLADPRDDIELIIVDDGSTDNTLVLARKIAATDVRVTVISLDQNMGVCAARNAGVSQARGVWVAFLDSDDEFPVGIYSRLLPLLERVPIDVGGFYARRRHDSGLISPPTLKAVQRLSGDEYLRLIEDNYFTNCDTFCAMRRATFTSLPWPARRVPEIEYHFAFARHFGILASPEVLYICHHGAANQLTRSGNLVKVLAHEIERVESYRRIIAAEGKAMRRHAPALRRLMIERSLMAEGTANGRRAMWRVARAMGGLPPWPRAAILLMVGTAMPSLAYRLKTRRVR